METARYSYFIGKNTSKAIYDCTENIILGDKDTFRDNSGWHTVENIGSRLCNHKQATEFRLVRGVITITILKNSKHMNTYLVKALDTASGEILTFRQFIHECFVINEFAGRRARVPTKSARNIAV